MDMGRTGTEAWQRHGRQQCYLLHQHTVVSCAPVIIRFASSKHTGKSSWQQSEKGYFTSMSISPLPALREGKIDGVMTVEEEARAYSTQDQAALPSTSILPKLLLAIGIN